jgi:hypothetical protein
MRLRRPAKPDGRRQRQPPDDLTPSPSSFAYSARRSEEKRISGRQTERQAVSPRQSGFGHSWLRRIGLIILLAAVVVSAANILSLSPDVKILPLSAGSKDNKLSILRPTAVYQAAADRQLKSSIWNRNKITVNTADLSRQLLSQFSELGSVSVTLPLLAHRPLVYIQPAQPALILVTQSSGAFIIDVNGKALLKASSAAVFNQPGLPVINDQSGLSLALNKQALPAANIRFIQTVAAQLAAKQFMVSDMTLPPAASELDVRLSGHPYFVKFNLQSSNPRGEAGTFLATIAQLSRQNIVPGQYVDVRVDGRAYYQ